MNATHMVGLMCGEANFIHVMGGVSSVPFPFRFPFQIHYELRGVITTKATKAAALVDF